VREVELTIHPFRMGTDKEAALKPLEEAAETFSSFQKLDATLQSIRKTKRPSLLQAELHDSRDALADELADCIQACVNLGDRYGIDLQAAMERCEERNRKRGRYE
jgi:NTP pyrophosphatase (non-canonical NTP hydrolase)